MARNRELVTNGALNVTPLERSRTPTYDGRKNRHIASRLAGSLAARCAVIFSPWSLTAKVNSSIRGVMAQLTNNSQMLLRRPHLDQQYLMYIVEDIT